MSEVDPLQEAREASYKKWALNKALKDKAFEYMAQIDIERAQKVETLVEVAISCLAVDKLIGAEEAQKANKDSASAKRTLKSAWFKWATEHLTLKELVLTDEDLRSVSGAVKEFLQSEYENMLGDPDEAKLARANRTKNILPSLKYYFPAIPKKVGEKVKPLNSDQKYQNVIFMRELKLIWNKAKTELQNRIVDYVARRARNDYEATVEREQKSKSGGYTSSRTPTEDGAEGSSLKRLENQCLHEIGLKRFKLWIEEDEDKRIQNENAVLKEKLDTAKKEHISWVNKKNDMRIALPSEMPPVPTQKFGYGRELEGVRPQAHGPATALELMAGSGLKYVHATSGKKEADAAKQKLLDMGYVVKENFDSKADFEREKRENTVISERIAQEKKMKEDNAKAYDEWLILKEMRDQAVKSLSLIDKPNIDESDLSRTSMSAMSANRIKYADTEEARYVIEVGKALKKVDRTLFREWAKWCDDILSTNTANILWDFFPPMACDVHCASYSQVRDAFLKLLRPGVDYRQTFVEFADKGVLARKIARLRDQDLPSDEFEEKRQQLYSQLALSKDQMTTLLRQLGIAMKPTEMRTLIDAFDENGDGVITLSEFLDFTGPKRDKKGGNSLVLNQRCCWMTTCKVTGMPNGYSVSKPTKRYMKNEAKNDSKYGDEEEEQENIKETEENSKFNACLTGNIVVRTLANGEKRMCVELLERKRREDILKKFGLIADDNKGHKKKSHGDTGDEYEDDYDNEHDDAYGDEFEEYHDGDNNNNKNHKQKNRKSSQSQQRDSKSHLSETKGVVSLGPCEFSTWTNDDRRSGLKFLLEQSHEARQEEILKNLLANGTPPQAPKFWISHERTIETKSKNKTSTNKMSTTRRNNNNDEEEDEEGGDCTSLTLYWSPQKGDLVSFYSIEFAGAIGLNSKVGDCKYQEIFRDPEDADPDKTFAFQYRVENLKPSTSYWFRIRAFNGFGPGPYCYKTFTTKADAPIQPRCIRIASDSCTLRWTFSEGFFRRLDELKRIFALADADGSGNVNREELTNVLDDKASGSPKLKTFLNKIATNLGLDLSQGYGALFDMIEGDDDGGLSWPEFENFFMSSGWGNIASTMQHGGGGTNPLSVRGSTASGAVSVSNPTAIRPGDIVYVVERCESEFDDTYVDAVKTTAGQALITRLEPGKSYRFRVYALNADGIPGPRSPTVLVHTLIETPPAPSIHSKHIFARKVILTWKDRNLSVNSRDKAAVNKMVGDWAGSHGENDGGVSIEAAFAKYDRNKSGDIDSTELACVLEDLGVEVNEERLSEAFALLDKNGDGVISYEEFGVWWRRDEVTYTIKRSEEIIPAPPSLIGGGEDLNMSRVSQGSHMSATGRQRAVSRGRSPNNLDTIPEGNSVNNASAVRSMSRPRSANYNATSGSKVGNTNTFNINNVTTRQVGVPIVSYRGSETRCTIAGLTPNRLYHFKLRYVGSRSNSALSPPLVLMTAPLPPTVPILVDVTASTMRIKWYAPDFGAYKFVVQLKMANKTQNALNTSASRRLSTSILGTEVSEDGWVTVYNGQDTVYVNTTLASDTSYQVRVLSANCQNATSEPSPVLTFNTLARTNTSGDTFYLTPGNANTHFVIDCTGDICVGDTILITERLYVKSVGDMGKDYSNAGTITGKAAEISAKKYNIRSGRSVVSANNNLNDSNRMSTNSINFDAASITASGQYIGDRTIAAYVSRDNYRTTRDLLQSYGITPKDMKKFGKYRKLWLEVVWQRCSSDACKPYELKPGEVLERQQLHLEQFVVYRCKWKQEKLRKSLMDEWNSLTECFVQTDC